MKANIRKEDLVRRLEETEELVNSHKWTKESLADCVESRGEAGTLAYLFGSPKEKIQSGINAMIEDRVISSRSEFVAKLLTGTKTTEEIISSITASLWMAVAYIGDLDEFQKQITLRLRSLRQVAVSEHQQLIKPLEDIRKFFLGEDHEKEVSRLKEFVDVCERLQKLKESGFLDTVADTLLKLA